MVDGDGDGDIISEKVQHFSKNITISVKAIEIVSGYMNRTKQNFSQTVDIIIRDWDKISVVVEKMRREKEFENIVKAKVRNEDKI